MSAARELREVNEASEAKEKSHGVAAFFDLDGTLVALPSLEQRLFRILRYRRLIPSRNYFLWLKEALRLMPRGISAICQANKMYLCGVHVLDECGEGDASVSSWHKDGHPSGVGASQGKGQASAPPSKRASKRAGRHPRLPVPTFFMQAIERVAWHAEQGHEIVLVSGTLEPLAREAARSLEAELAARGIRATIRVLATRLEARDGRWTGRILGEAMFGEVKARAAKRLAEEMDLDLARCFAYGDSESDRWMLATVGRPAAVNPSRALEKIAMSNGWPILRWELKDRARRRRNSARAGAQRGGIAMTLPANCTKATGAAEIAERVG